LGKRIGELTKLIKKLTHDDIKRKIRNTIKPGDQRTFWKATNLALNRGDITQQTEISWGDLKAENDEQKSKMFAEFFQKKIADLTSKAAIDDEVFNGHQYPIPGDHNFFNLELVERILKSTKKAQCAGFDRIPMIYVSDLAEFLAPIIHLLFCKIYEQNLIPEQWKIGKITPIPKKGDKSKIENYRPITSLCTLAKAFEKCLLYRINTLFEDHDVTNVAQHGFKK